MKPDITNPATPLATAKELAASLPQDTDQQKLVKARELLAVGDLDTGQKLLAELSKAELEKGDRGYSATQYLVQACLGQKKQQEAMGIIAEVLKKVKAPDDVLWKGMEAAARGDAKPDEIEKLNDEYIGLIPDEGERTLRRYQMLALQN